MGSILILFLVLLPWVYGRGKPNTDEDMGTKMRKDILYKMIVEEFMEKPWKKYIDELKKEKNANPSWRDQYSSDLIEVPVIVHVLYDRNEFIIGNEQIQSGFRALNDAFFDINYWDKDTELMKEYNYLAGNFSMQFKLSNIIYVDVTEFEETIDVWSEENCTSVSPNYEQNHYLHFYIAPSIGDYVYGVSSFPMPEMSIEECVFGITRDLPVQTEEECSTLIGMPIQIINNIKFIGIDGVTCLDVVSGPEIPPGEGPPTEEACMDIVDEIIKVLSEAGFSWESTFNGADCLEYKNNINNDICEEIVNKKDLIQVIRFGSTYFGTIDDDSRQLFSNGQSSWNLDMWQVVPHEAGHWVGLRHIFSDHDVCRHGDGVDDTATQEKKYDFTCPDKEDAYSCNSTDMYNNIMDYSNCDSIKYQFTQGQVERGRYFFEDPTQLRHSFLDY
eukprot:520116_1